MADISAATRAHIDSKWHSILAALASGALVMEALRDAGVTRDQMLAYRAGRPDLKAQWEDAREASADALFDEAMQEARAKHSKEDAPHVRTRIDTLKWAARIRNPRLYGEKAQLDVNVRTVDLTRIIEAANARLAAGRVLDMPHNSGALSDATRALLPAPGALADLL